MSGATQLLLKQQRLVMGSTSILTCFILVGCGSSGIERASIHGNVTLDGQPVESGSIRLVPTGEKGGPSSGGEIIGGEYDIDDEKGPTLGPHRVEVYIPYNTGRKVPSPMGGVAPVTTIDPNSPQTAPQASQNQAGLIEAWADKAPLRYNRESILEVNIESGSNEFNIQMDSK